jgi:hypothetical protein
MWGTKWTIGVFVILIKMSGGLQNASTQAKEFADKRRSPHHQEMGAVEDRVSLQQPYSTARLHPALVGRRRTPQAVLAILAAYLTNDSNATLIFFLALFYSPVLYTISDWL